MDFFKKMTDGSFVICGRKTYDTLPKLPRRNVIVISSHKVESNSKNSIYACDNNIEKVAKIAKEADIPYFVIGGASIYEQFAKYATELCVTLIRPHDGYVYETDTKIFDFQKDFECVDSYTEYDQKDLLNDGVVSDLRFTYWVKK